MLDDVMSDAIPIARIDDFSVIGGSKPDPAAAAGRQAWERSTREVLARAGSFAPQGKLGGSFIYAHPPDYRGRPTLHFSTEDWRIVFREFKELGLDTAIWQASVLMELRECYYPSAVLGHYKQWNVIEPMLQAAADEKMTVYLGSFGVLKGEISLGVLDGDPRRFLYQLTVADRLGARKLVTWEAMHFLDPNGTDKARELRRAVLAHHGRDTSQ